MVKIICWGHHPQTPFILPYLRGPWPPEIFSARTAPAAFYVPLSPWIAEFGSWIDFYSFATSNYACLKHWSQSCATEWKSFVRLLSSEQYGSYDQIRTSGNPPLHPQTWTLPKGLRGCRHTLSLYCRPVAMG